MRVIRADRWHQVETKGPVANRVDPHCSVCGGHGLAHRGEVVLDSVSRQRYDIVRCDHCGSDLLERILEPLAS